MPNFTIFVLYENKHSKTTHTNISSPKVVWKITPLFAEWISSPTNPLFTHEILTNSSSIIELGCGIAGIVGLLTAPLVSNYVLTDQIYVAKLLEENLASNKPEPRGKSNTNKQSRPSKQQPKSSHASSSPGGPQIRFHPLDWETDTPTPSLLTPSSSKSFDAILACDCIYNEALVEPFVSTCVEICKFKLQDPDSPDSPSSPCIVVVALHLRDPSVFEAFITALTSKFHVWRVPDSLLVEGLRSNSGFVVHVGVMKGAIPEPEHP